MKRVSLIIPTTGNESRRKSLFFAIESGIASSSFPIDVIVVVNGNKSSPDVLLELNRRKELRVEYCEQPSAPAACLFGLKQVSTEYFCFLDDDDEYISHAIDKRVEYLDDNPSLDIVVTNGIRAMSDSDDLCIKNLTKITEDPLFYSVTNNWLASCGGMYRSCSIPPSLFEDYLPYIEWTWLAYKFAFHGKKIGIIDSPTFRINQTPGSASKSKAYEKCFHDLFNKMLATNPPPHVREAILTRVGDLFHSEAEAHLLKGEIYSAWRKHLRSLAHPRGLRYLPFTRKLLF